MVILQARNTKSKTACETQTIKLKHDPSHLIRCFDVQKTSRFYVYWQHQSPTRQNIAKYTFKRRLFLQAYTA